jgi:DNA-binding NtrC family response regulator
LTVTDLTTKKLLIVDDEPDIASALKVGLQRSGIDVSAFSDPVKALEELKKHNYDLVITDIRMPNMTGFELYQKMRQHGIRTPVIFMTAFDIYQSEFEKMFPHIEPVALLKKPIGVAEFARCVHNIIDDYEQKKD